MLAALRRAVRTLLSKERVEQDLSDEVLGYVDLLSAEKEAAGMEPKAARRAALIEVGGVEQVKEHVRHARPGALIDQIGQDLRQGLRALTRHPRFSAAVVATLGLAIGATSALFAVMDSVLLRPLPYREPERLVLLYELLPGANRPFGFSAPDFAGFVERAQSFESVAAFRCRTYELSGIETPERLSGALVSSGLFRLLGVAPALGREFTDDEDRGGKPVAILSDALWARKFSRDPRIVGKGITLDRTNYTVVGVLPPRLVFPSPGPSVNNVPAEVYVPVSFTPRELEAFGSMYNSSVVARLKPGVSISQAALEAKAIAARIVTELYPASFSPKLDITVAPVRDEVVGNVRTPLLGLFAAVALVLLIACADIANLTLTRAVGRGRELAVRAALGASRTRLVRQLLVETTVLGVCGGALGVLLARLGLELLAALAPVSLPRANEIGLDGRVLVFAGLLSLVTGLLSGALPAWEAGRRDPVGTLKETGRGTTSARQRRTIAVLVSAQFALATVLLVVGGLVGRSLQHLLATEPGFRPERVLTVRASLPGNGYPEAPQVRTFYERLLERASGLPGVRAAAVSSYLPLAVLERRGFSIEGQPSASADLPHVVAHDWVAGQYFEAMGIALRRGRVLDDGDRAGSEPVVVINETMARQFWPGEDALDRRIKWGGFESDAPWMRIVGIVGDIKQGALNTQTMPQTWQPWRQVSDEGVADTVVGVLRSLRLILRTDGAPEALIGSLRAELRRLDPALPVTELRTMEDLLQASTSPQRWRSGLFVGFAGIALLLAALGVAGVLAESVSRRTHEIGIRLALGAARGHVLRLVLREGLGIAALGMLVGLAAAPALTRLISSLLFEVSPRDPVTFGGVVVLLAGVAVAACLIPALRATRVDPAAALRHD